MLPRSSPAFLIYQVTLLLLSFLFANPTLADDSATKHLSKLAKTYPESRRWPSHASWKHLNATVSGRLIAPHPAALACYPGPHQSRLACYRASPLWEAREAYIQDPVRVGSKWHSGFGCEPVWTADERQHCGLGNYPLYVVRAGHVRDVVAAVKFAGEHGVRLVIKGTGHDFMGRSAGFGSLSIWTRDLTGVEVVEVFVPQGHHLAGGKDFTDENGRNISAVTVGAGEQWENIYRSVYWAGKMVVGPTEGSVGAVGWGLGGGYGPLSNKFGLGVDNILEMEVVLASGEVVVSNEFQHEDLFWAMRGGGGGTYGVVTKITYRTFPLVAQPGIQLMIAAGSSGTAGYHRALASLLSQMPKFVDFGLTGRPVVTSESFRAHFTATGRTRDEINGLMKPVIANMRKLGVTVTSVDIASWLNTFLGPNSRLTNVMMGSGQRTGDVMLSRLVSRSACANITQWEKLLPVLLSEGYVLEPSNVLGGAVDDNTPAVNGTSVHPAWRTAVLHLNVFDRKMQHTNLSTVRKSYVRLNNQFSPLLEDISEEGAAYFNEASYLEEDWSNSFWGWNYDRLVETKREYDPNNTFWCWKCVGSDVFTLGANGKLYLSEE